MDKVGELKSYYEFLTSANCGSTLSKVIADEINTLEITPEELETVVMFFSPEREWDGVLVFWGITFKIVHKKSKK